MTKRRWDDDQCVFDDLAQAWREVAPAAEALTTRAHAAFSWRTVDDDLLLASLNFDSVVEPFNPRASAHPRILLFSSTSLSMEMEVLTDQIVGQLVPPSVARVVVESTTEARWEVRSDERGFFIVSPLPAGPVRLSCDTLKGRLITDWVTL